MKSCHPQETKTESAGSAAVHHARGQIAVTAGAGMLASALLLTLYFGLLTGLSGWSFTLDQFRDFWPYITALAIGFGVQVGLFTYLHRAVHAAHSGKVVAVSGTTSGVAMMSCCAHYLVNLLPALGATGFVTLATQYQIELFWVGLAANLAGIAYVGSRLVAFLHEERVVGRPTIALLVLFVAVSVAGLPLPSLAQQASQQVNKEGQVTVQVTPVLLAPAAETWRFKVVFDTHSVALDQDLLAITALDAGGSERKPLAWEGSPPGGHHREGELVFKAVNPVPSSVSLKIRNVGPVPERSFTWSLGTP